LPARILVVYDDPLTGKITVICENPPLGRHGAGFPTSSTEVAELLKREKYHGVFLDMRMPAPDGAELAGQLRASRVNASTVIVMITGEQDRTVMGRTFEARVEFFLFKPVERNKLLKLIRATEGPIERERRPFTRVRLRYRVSMDRGMTVLWKGPSGWTKSTWPRSQLSCDVVHLVTLAIVPEGQL